MGAIGLQDKMICRAHTDTEHEHARSNTEMTTKQRMQMITAILLGLPAVTSGLVGSLAGEIWLLGGAIALALVSLHLIGQAQHNAR